MYSEGMTVSTFLASDRMTRFDFHPIPLFLSHLYSYFLIIIKKRFFLYARRRVFPLGLATSGCGGGLTKALPLYQIR